MKSRPALESAVWLSVFVLIGTVIAALRSSTTTEFLGGLAVAMLVAACLATIIYLRQRSRRRE